jgi:hypothetical protein
MKKFMIGIAALVILTATSNAQPGPVAVINNYGFSQASVVFKTGYADVACAGGVCLVPQQYGGAAAIPQSSAFFALSNPKVLEFRTRQFIQVPHTQAIVTTDSYGNQIILNAGISNNPHGVVLSHGQKFFAR